VQHTGGGTPTLTFLFDDQFVTADAAPLTIPRNAEPGPGAWNALVDTGNRISIASGVLTSAGGGGATDPYMTTSTTFARATGMALKFDLPNVPATIIGSVMWRSNAAQANYASQTGMIPVNNISIRSYATGSGSVPFTVPSMTGKTVTGWTILRTTGYWNVIRYDGAYYLLSALTLGTETNMPLHLSGQGAVNLDNVRVAQLGNPWTDDAYLRSYLSATPANNETQTSEADAFHNITWTPAANEIVNLIIRRTSDTDYWTIRADEAGNTIKIIEVVAGGETERGSTAATINAGTTYRIFARALGSSITGNISGQSAGYGSAATNLTATGTKITISGAGTLADWMAWVVNIPAAGGAQLALMDVA
jgi:hypothetical protein